MVYPPDVKAIGFDDTGNDDALLIVDRPPRELDEGSIRIAVAAAALNRADLLQRRGAYPPPPGAPDTLGLECAGTVVETAPGISRPGICDRVMALVPGGGQAEDVVVHHGSVIPTPEHFNDHEAGAFPEVFLTAFLNLFTLGGLERGGTALVHGGSGGVGTAAIALVRAAGARALVTAGSDERCRRCLDLGAELAINYRTTDFVDSCLEATSNEGVDVVLDCIGGRYLERNLRALAKDGRLVCIGLMGGSSGELDLRRLLSRRLQLIGSTLRALPNERKAAIVREFLDRFGADLDEGRLRPVIDSVYPMDRAEDAYARLASGDAFGKVVLAIP
jgi:NADPH2:quinone reductase